jgi:1-deoxy-D-xylulose-5-phosphate synthase
LPSIFINHASPEAMYRVPGMTAHEIEAKALEVLGVLTAGKCAQCACVDAGRFPTLPN